MKPLAVGTVVTYHGSLSVNPDRKWVVRGHNDPKTMFRTQELAGAVAESNMDAETLLGNTYPDGVAYEIWPKDVLYKFGNRCHSVYRVRRDSLTPVEGKDDGR
jgi:hypothetical protein